MVYETITKSIHALLRQLQAQKKHIDQGIAKLEGFLGHFTDSLASHIQGRGRSISSHGIPSRGASHSISRGSTKRMGARSRAIESHRKPQRLPSASASASASTPPLKTRARKAWSQKARHAAAERMKNYWKQRHTEAMKAAKS